MATLFQYDSYLRDCFKVIQLKGKFIEHETATALLTELESDVQKDTRMFLIDLKELNYMNSVGITSIVKLVHLINLNGGTLVFANVPERIKELLELIRLNSVLSICDSCEEGFRALAS